jgi:bifunctional enzyme CysN/CysC
MNIREFLQQDAQKDLLRLVIVGSVDDGKSTLVGRLLHDCHGLYEDQLESVRKSSEKRAFTEADIDYSLFTDGLKAEREQGITIDVAYRYFATHNRKFILADTPGHEQYTRNMVTGASTADLAIVLIDARLGVLPQSRRHGYLASQLGITHLVVAINKLDCVDFSREVFERLRDEYFAFTKQLNVPRVHFLPISALKGDNVVTRSSRTPWYDGPHLLELLETVDVKVARNLEDMRFPVQHVLRPNMSFRGYSGTLASGRIKPGDDVLALPSRQRSRVKRLVTWDGDLPEALPGQAVTVELTDELDLSRGDMLVHPTNPPSTRQRVQALLVWMDQSAVLPGTSLLLRHTTRTVPATLSAIDGRLDIHTLKMNPAESLSLNDIGHVAIDLRRPLFTDPYRRNRTTGAFILIDRQTFRTLGAGMLLDQEQCSEWEGGSAAEQLANREGPVIRQDRESLAGQRGTVVWLTGLPGSGKTAIAEALEKRLVLHGHMAITLDADRLRRTLSSDLGFSAEDRAENVRRAGDIAALLTDTGAVVIAAFISPHRADRARAREALPPGRFLEVHVDAPLSVCEQRETKGLYARARAGDATGVTGIDAPYEPPEKPDLVLATHEMTVDQSVDRLYALVQKSGALQLRPPPDYMI